jgi:putative protein-disulfide isomerase
MIPTNQWKAGAMNENKELIYVGDPMCSWCFGFSSIKKQLQEQCRDRSGVRLVVGGLHAYTEDTWQPSYRKFLRDHWTEIGSRSGQKFSFDILERTDFIYDTEPACRAAVAARTMEGELRGLDFFSAIQKAFYTDNRDVTQAEVLIDLANTAGLEKERFAELLGSEEMKIATARDFQFARELGVTGFPTVVLRDGEGYSYLTVGYQEFERLESAIDAWLVDSQP